MQCSLDERELKQYLKPCRQPMQLSGSFIPSDESPLTVDPCLMMISLDGEWDLIEQQGHIDFSESIKATVPGSVHTALLRNGCIKDENGVVITDPYFGKNDRYFREASHKDYLLKRMFSLTPAEAKKPLRLCFDGVCDTCEVYLNGKRLGSHIGTFGGPDFIVTDLVKAGENELIVLLHGAPLRKRKPYEFPTFFNGGNPFLNLGWLDTVTFNCTYGWHYANIPPVGIWRSVRLIEIPSVEIVHPFIYTKDISGRMGVEVELNSTVSGEVFLRGIVTPKNFRGEPQEFYATVDVKEGNNSFDFELNITDPQLWWPNGLGEQNLYEFTLQSCYEEQVLDSRTVQFGIRTARMIPNADENGKRVVDPEKYNWTFTVNGEPFFVKGTGWCTNDALMRFDRERYDRFLTLARQQNINMVRAWGGGLVETEEFYDLCDEYGITVFQEWPTAWDSYMIQPEEALLETVERGIYRLRNRACLFIWCGGNEGSAPLDPTERFDPTVLNALGKKTIELDPTRPWHRQEPFGGSLHDYRASWGHQNPSVNMTLEAPFFGEFGVDCWPNMESVKRCVPEEEWKTAENWSIDQSGMIAHHTPMFNQANDVFRLQKHVPLFIAPTSMENCVIGSQLAQVVGVRYTLERARTRWPQCSGAIMYKLNDPYPAASWSTVDWYGSPKPGHYFVMDAFAPVAAIPRLEESELVGKQVCVPVYLCNDPLSTGIDRVEVRVYNEAGSVVKNFVKDLSTVAYTPQKVTLLGEMVWDEQITENVPLFVVSEVWSNEKLLSRNWYFLNYESKQGCLFRCAETQLSVVKTGEMVIIKNVGERPAIAVQFKCEAVSDVFLPDDNWFWLEAGEEKVVFAPNWSGVNSVTAWNAPISFIVD